MENPQNPPSHTHVSHPLHAVVTGLSRSLHVRVRYLPHRPPNHVEDKKRAGAKRRVTLCASRNHTFGRHMVPGGDLGSFPAAFLLVEELLPDGECGSGLVLRGWKSSTKQDGRTGTVPFSLVPRLNMPASFCRGLLFDLLAPVAPALPMLATLPVL